MFNAVDNNVNFPQLEEQILKFWRDGGIYEKSLEQRNGSPSFVFFEGPPTANGKPHPGHCLTRAMKDLFPRYKTMKGFRCERKAGWDTHGLPVEVEVGKGLGIHSKEQIEEYGIEPFIQLCQKSVWQYMKQWEELTERLGFWMRLDEAYVTYHQSYVESVWWSLKTLFDRGLLYQGHKIVWWWAQGGTALSSGEVGEGYREVADPSVFVLFPLLDRENTSLLVWTTTPWTLPSNQFAAVHDEIEYATVHDEEMGQDIILANDLVETIGKKLKRELTIKSTCKGSELVGLRYQPPFDYYYKDLGDQQGQLKDGGQQHVAWRITSADFVTTKSGSGAVHEAPAFGEVDYELLVEEQKRFSDNSGPKMICAVGPNGKFTNEAPDFAGMWVKDADKPVIQNLKERGLLYFQEQYLHDYPFCWRADQDPLIQYPRKSWFIRTTEFKDAMLANNSEINWLPEHIKTGRFGKFLESNVDWTLSRERFWGTPLPVWVCDKSGQMEAIGNYDELLAKHDVQGTEVWAAAKAKDPDLCEDLKVHKPYIDEVTYQSPFDESGRMRRVTEVIDCWYDSGSMPFAQWGYPQTNQDRLDAQFPADFISEAIDQTRGWFYSLSAISTMLFGEKGQAKQDEDYPHPFKNCIVLGLMQAQPYFCAKCDAKKKPARYLEEIKKCPECGGKITRKTEKMSKKLRNYREPKEIFDVYGADALRWYFFANQPPWTNIIYSERSIKESIPEFLLRLWNVYSFFVNYAQADGFSPGGLISSAVGDLNSDVLGSAASYRPAKERNELDRWILSELAETVEFVTDRMDAYDNYGACKRLTQFVEGLSNWYLRLSRPRFWSKEKADPMKLDAYWTLMECLTTICKLIAPFVPFTSENIWKNLSGVFKEATESVHLCDYPTTNSEWLDRDLSEKMALLREVASLGRSARAEAKLKVRQPLQGVTVALNDSKHQSWLEGQEELLKQELNVKSITYTSDAAEFVSYQVVPNFKSLGPRVGKLMPQVKKMLTEADGSAFLKSLTENGKIVLEIEDSSLELDNGDIEVRLNAKEGWSAAEGAGCVVVLATELTDELIREGKARDLVRLVNDYRKQRDLQLSDQINLFLATSDEELKSAINEHLDYIKAETQAIDVTFQDDLTDPLAVECQIADADIKLFLTVVEMENV
jgi:isoleucyl-tRNA synthetase